MLSFVSWPREVLVWLLNVFEGVLNQIYIIALLLPKKKMCFNKFFGSALYIYIYIYIYIYRDTDPVKILNADPDIDINFFSSFLIFVPHGPKFD